MVRLVALSIIIVLLALPMVGAQNFTVRLNINNTDHKVFIPVFSDEFDSGSLPTIPSELRHFYLASYLNNLLTGLVAAEGTSLDVSSTENTHSLEITQDLQGSRVFLVFSTGDYRNIDRVIGIIEARNFLNQISPSFAFGLGTMYPIKEFLSYSAIDIVGDFIVQKGGFSLLIKNIGVSGGRPQVELST